MSNEKHKCKCGSLNTVRNGFMTQRTGKYQAYICNECGRRFKGEKVKEAVK